MLGNGFVRYLESRGGGTHIRRSLYGNDRFVKEIKREVNYTPKPF